MKKLMARIISLTIILTAFAMGQVAYAGETEVAGGATNLKWSATSSVCTWDWAANSTVNDQKILEVKLVLYASKDGTNYEVESYTTFSAGKSEYDYRTVISDAARRGYRYFKYQLNYLIDYYGNSVAASEYSDVLALPAEAVVYNAVSNLSLDGNTLSWTGVSGCSKYTIIPVAGSNYPYIVTEHTSYNVSDLIQQATENGSYYYLKLKVIAGDYSTDWATGSLNIPSPERYKYAALHFIRVGNRIITGTNPDVFGDGTVSYDGETKTLTLNKAHIRSEVVAAGMPYSDGIYISQIEGVTIKLIGQNELVCSETRYVEGIASYNDLTICGDGSLAIYMNNVEFGCSGIMNDSCDLLIKDATIDIYISTDTANTTKYVEGIASVDHVILDNAKVSVAGSGNINKGAFHGVYSFNEGNDLVMNNHSCLQIEDNINTGEAVNTAIDFANLKLNSGCLNIKTEGNGAFAYNTDISKDLTKVTVLKDESKGVHYCAGDLKLAGRTYATCTKDGTETYSCPLCSEGKFVKTIAKISTVKLSTNTYTYDGKVKTPTVTVKDSAGKTISSKYYTLTKDTGRSKVGRYSYKISFKTKYKDSKTLYFTIKPKKAVISSAAAGTDKITVKMSSNAASTGGSTYQIAYRVKGTSTWKTTTTTSQTKTILSLKKGKKYEIKVRAYKTVNGSKYYGSYSSVKTSASVK